MESSNYWIEAILSHCAFISIWSSCRQREISVLEYYSRIFNIVLDECFWSFLLINNLHWFFPDHLSLQWDCWTGMMCHIRAEHWNSKEAGLVLASMHCEYRTLPWNTRALFATGHNYKVSLLSLSKLGEKVFLANKTGPACIIDLAEVGSLNLVFKYS